MLKIQQNAKGILWNITKTNLPAGKQQKGSQITVRVRQEKAHKLN